MHRCATFMSTNMLFVFQAYLSFEVLLDEDCQKVSSIRCACCCEKSCFSHRAFISLIKNNEVSRGHGFFVLFLCVFIPQFLTAISTQGVLDTSLLSVPYHK